MSEIIQNYAQFISAQLEPGNKLIRQAALMCLCLQRVALVQSLRFAVDSGFYFESIRRKSDSFTLTLLTQIHFLNLWLLK